MKKNVYYVSLPFSGSLTVEVEAMSEEDALAIGKERIEALSEQDVLDSVEYDNYEVHR